MSFMKTYSGKNRSRMIFRAAVSDQLSGQCQNTFSRRQAHVRKKYNKNGAAFGGGEQNKKTRNLTVSGLFGTP